jgi:hypothetical protein
MKLMARFLLNFPNSIFFYKVCFCAAVGHKKHKKTTCLVEFE